MAIKSFINEEWKEVDMGYPSKKKYVISNYGRFVSYIGRLENGKHIVGSDLKGYKIYAYKFIEDEKIHRRHFLLHRMVALHFLPPPTEDQTLIIHLNFNKSYNHVSNLKWANTKEAFLHNLSNHLEIDTNKKSFYKTNKGNLKGIKLNAEKAKMIKKKIFDPDRKTRYKTIAKQFGISEMAIYRMKRGENWGEIE